MASALLAADGHTTIPKEVRDRLKLKAGDRVEFVIQEDGTALLIPKRVDVADLEGILVARRHVSLEEMDDAIREGAAAE